MGLCKCPERKVTHIFCYEHRVNVCDYCLLKNHPKCVVDSYRNWITDSVFSSKCGLCDDELVNAETVRLLCYHIVHWDCLDNWARALPETTAPAGYNCPICNQMCLFPKKNQESPIADQLRSKMGEVNWARVGLGLPLLDNEVQAIKGAHVNGIVDTASSSTVYQKSEIPDHSFGPVTTKFSRPSEVQSPQPYANHNHSYPSSASNLTQNVHYGANQNQNHFYSESSQPSTSGTYIPNPRKSVRSEFEMDTPLLIDEDDHKYRRRSPFESLSRWIKNSATVQSRRGRKRTALYVILAIIAALLLFMFMFGRSGSDDEGSFNPESNPNVMIGGGLGVAHHAQNDEAVDA